MVSTLRTRNRAISTWARLDRQDWQIVDYQRTQRHECRSRWSDGSAANLNLQPPLPPDGARLPTPSQTPDQPAHSPRRVKRLSDRGRFNQAQSACGCYYGLLRKFLWIAGHGGGSQPARKKLNRVQRIEAAVPRWNHPVGNGSAAARKGERVPIREKCLKSFMRVKRKNVWFRPAHARERTRRAAMQPCHRSASPGIVKSSRQRIQPFSSETPEDVSRHSAGSSTKSRTGNPVDFRRSTCPADHHLRNVKGDGCEQRRIGQKRTIFVKKISRQSDLGLQSAP